MCFCNAKQLRLCHCEELLSVTKKYTFLQMRYSKSQRGALTLLRKKVSASVKNVKFIDKIYREFYNNI